MRFVKALSTALPAAHHAAAIVTASMGVGCILVAASDYRKPGIRDWSFGLQMLVMCSVAFIRSAVVLRSDPSCPKTRRFAGQLGVFNLVACATFNLLMLHFPQILPHPALLSRLIKSGPLGMSNASLPTAITEQGYASRYWPEWLVVLLAEVHAYCTYRYLLLGKHPKLRAFITQQLSIVALPWLLRRLFKTYPAVAVTSLAARMSLMESMVEKSTAQLDSSSNACSDDGACCSHSAQPFNTELSRASATSIATRPTSVPNKKLYVSSLKSRYQVSIKLQTSANPSDLPPDALDKLRQIVQDAGARCGQPVTVLQAAVRAGCILISASVLPDSTSVTDTFPGGLRLGNAMQLAKAMLPDLLPRIGLNPSPASGDYLSLQIGQTDRVIAKWSPEQDSWDFQQDHCLQQLFASKATPNKPVAAVTPVSTPRLGLVRCHPGEDPVFWDSAAMSYLKATNGMATAASHSRIGSNSSSNGGQNRRNHLETAYGNTSSATVLCARLQVHMYGAAGAFRVQGSYPDAPTGPCQTHGSSSPAHGPGVMQCMGGAGGVPQYQLWVQGSCGYGEAHVYRCVPLGDDMAASLVEVEVRLPAASLARHHEGGPCAALQPLTLQLWAGDAWVSTTHCCLPLAEPDVLHANNSTVANGFGWWGGISAGMASAAASELQAITQSLWQTVQIDPDSCSPGSAIEAECEGIQDLIHDLSCWLATVRHASHEIGHCMVNGSAVIGSAAVVQADELHPYAHHAGLSDPQQALQVGTDLRNFAAVRGMPVVQSLLAGSANNLLKKWAAQRKKPRSVDAPVLIHRAARLQRHAVSWAHALRASVFGSNCSHCECLYEHHVRSNLGVAYGFIILALGIAAMVSVAREGGTAPLAALPVATFGSFYILLGMLLLRPQQTSVYVLKKLHLAIALLRLLTNAGLACGLYPMLSSVRNQHSRGLWPIVYGAYSLAERTPLINVLPSWLITVMNVFEAGLLYAVTSPAYPWWWQALLSIMTTLGFPLLLDAHLRNWLVSQPPTDAQTRKRLQSWALAKKAN